MATVVALAPAASAAPVPVPRVPARLPAAIESYPAYVQDNSCDVTAKPGTLALSQLLRQTYPSTSVNATTRTCGTDTMVSYSEHYDGRSVDWGVSVRNSSKKYGDAFAKWLVGKDERGVPGGNARRLGVMYLIWNNKQWWGWAPQKGWFDYRGCSTRKALAGAAHDSACHRNHLHITLSWEGAMKRTSWWTGHVARQDFGPCRPADLNWSSGYTRFNGTRCPSSPHVRAEDGSSTLHKRLVTFSGITVRQGMVGPVVKVVQQLVGITADGEFGPATRAVVARWQREQGLVGDGVVGYRTWRAALLATRPSLSRYYGTVLRQGSRGAAVKALQERLGALAVDGRYGPATAAAVSRFQASKHLPADGVTDRATWLALDGKKATAATQPKRQPAKPKHVAQPKPKHTAKPKHPAKPKHTAKAKRVYAAYYRSSVRYGSRGRAVKVLQNALGGLQRDGVFGPATRRKVNTLKRANGLRVDGVAGSSVWHILGHDYTPWVSKRLHQGSRGRYVKIAQNALGGLRPDGIFGPATRRQVNRFKRAHHLRANGVIDRGVWRALSAR